MINIGLPVIKRNYARMRAVFRMANRSLGFGALRLYNTDTAWNPADMPGLTIPAQFTSEDLQLLNCIRLELSNEIGALQTITNGDVLYFALQELQLALGSANREDEVLRLKFQLWDTK
jgi:hypothetical protein